MDTKYTLTFNEKQARIISTALDLFGRIHLGQFNTIADLLLDKRHTKLESRSQILSGLNATAELYTGLPSRTSFGITSPEVHDDARIAYDIHQVIRHRLFWDKVSSPTGVFRTVDSDDPWKTSHSEPLATIQSSKRTNDSILVEDLTEREWVVLNYIWEKGYKPKQMARDLAVSNHTVKSHIKAILQKLCVNNMTDAILQAVRLKMVEV